MNSRAPEFGKLVASRRWAEMDRLFARTMRQSIVVAISGTVTACLFLYYLQSSSWPLGQRFLRADQAALLFVAISITVGIYGFATYLRSHKKEPLLAISVIGAALQGFATWYLGSHYSSMGVACGFVAISGLFSLPATYLIWLRLRRKWHQPLPETVSG
jgi:O-antigen/teichoic acid export membrane protein